MNAAERLTAPLTAYGQLGPGENTLYVGLQPPEGAKLSQGSPVEIRASGRGLSFPARVKVKLEPGAHIPVPVKISPGASERAEFKLSYFWCHDSEAGSSGQCVRENAHVTVHLDLSGDRGGGEAYFDYRPGRAAH